MENRRNGERNSRAAQAAQRLREERAKQEKELELRAKREKQKKKQARKERNSRAAQTAQRQREERKEDSRLDGLRQKQKKEARQRTKKRISPAFWRRLLIMLGVTVAVILILVIFFRVRYVEVEGNHYYSAEEISSICGVEEGDNLLTLSRGEIAGNIMAQRYYVKNVRVSRKLPNTIKLTIEEYPVTYVVKDTQGNNYLITADGKAVEIVDDKEARNHISIEGLNIQPTVLGEMVSLAQEEGVDVGKLSTMIRLLKALEDAELARLVSSVNIPTSRNITLWYTDRFEVALGSVERIDYKLEYLKIAVSRQKDYDTGTIDLTLGLQDAAIVKINE